MPEKIYILLKNSDDCRLEIDEFVNNMKEQKIDVEEPVGIKSCADTGETVKLSQDLEKGSLIITDYSPEEIEMKNRFDGGISAGDSGRTLYIVGYGLDYKGNVPYIIDSLGEVSAGYMRLIYSRYAGKPYTVAVTEHLIIREMCLEDLDAMYDLYNSLSHCPYIEPLYERSREEEFTRNYIRDMYGFYQYGLWLLFDRETGSLVGRAGIENRVIDKELCRELGYLVDKRWQGRGFAYEASLAILEYARSELGLEEMYICTHINNKPSISLAKKLGFELYAGNIDGMNLYKKYL